MMLLLFRYVHGTCDQDADISTYQHKKEQNPDYEYHCPLCKSLTGRQIIAKRKDSKQYNIFLWIIWILPWSKSFRNLFRKTKIQIYSSKSIFSPSKYSSSIATHLRQRLIQSSKHFLYSVFGIAIRVFDFFIISTKMRSPHRFFESTEQEEVAGGQIRRILWLLDDIRSVLSQKVADNNGIVRPRITWFPQIGSFLANCFMQTSHNSLIILLINCLTFWQKFMMHNPVVIHEKRDHRLLFRLKTTYIFWSWLIRCAGVRHSLDWYLDCVSYS